MQCSRMRLRPGLRPGPPLVSRQGGTGKGEKGKGEEGRGKGGRAGEGRGGNLTVTRSCNRAADWLRPALVGVQFE